MSEGVIFRFLNSKQTHFKIQPKGFIWSVNVCSIGRKQAFMSYLSESTNYEITSCCTPPIKFWL